MVARWGGKRVPKPKPRRFEAEGEEEEKVTPQASTLLHPSLVALRMGAPSISSRPLSDSRCVFGQLVLE